MARPLPRRRSRPRRCALGSTGRSQKIATNSDGEPPGRKPRTRTSQRHWVNLRRSVERPPRPSPPHRPGLWTNSRSRRQDRCRATVPKAGREKDHPGSPPRSRAAAPRAGEAAGKAGRLHASLSVHTRRRCGRLPGGDPRTSPRRRSACSPSGSVAPPGAGHRDFERRFVGPVARLVLQSW